MICLVLHVLGSRYLYARLHMDGRYAHAIAFIYGWTSGRWFTRCNATGRCGNCACVKANKKCNGCLPSRLGQCRNSDTNRTSSPSSLTSSFNSVMPTDEFGYFPSQSKNFIVSLIFGCTQKQPKVHLGYKGCSLVHARSGQGIQYCSLRTSSWKRNLAVQSSIWQRRETLRDGVNKALCLRIIS